MNLLETFLNLQFMNPHAVLTGLISLGCLLLIPRLTQLVPGSLVGMIVASVVAYELKWDVETIGSRFGGIPRMLPLPKLPALSFTSFLHVLQPAFTIAILGAIESLLSCVVADSKTGERHDSNRELIGQGVANVLTPLFGGIPATGAIARTMTNIRNGGNSPVAGVVHAVTLLVMMMLFAPWANRIPLATLAPILMVVAWNMSEVHQIAHILKGTRSDIAVLITTLLLTVFADLTVAVEFGLLMAAILFIKRMSDVHRVQKVLPDFSDPKCKVRAIDEQTADCPQVTILTVEGALFFGAAQKFEQETLSHIPSLKSLILRMSKVPVIDATGEKALHSIWEDCQKHKVALFLSGLGPQPEGVLEATGLLSKVGKENLFPRTGPALDLAISRMDVEICAECPSVVFRECEALKYRGMQEFTRRQQNPMG
ncbi:MAG: SulP family inorganic anion transporter [Terriglobia bacterium]